MEVNGIFIKQMFIPNSDTLIKVNNFLICKTAVSPNFSEKWKVIDTNLIQEWVLSSEMFLGNFSFSVMWILAVSACLWEALHPQ